MDSLAGGVDRLSGASGASRTEAGRTVAKSRAGRAGSRCAWYLPAASDPTWSVTLGKTCDETETSRDLQRTEGEARAPVAASALERGCAAGHQGPAHRSVAARQHGRPGHEDPAEAGGRGQRGERKGSPAPAASAAEAPACAPGRPPPLAARTEHPERRYLSRCTGLLPVPPDRPVEATPVVGRAVARSLRRRSSLPATSRAQWWVLAAALVVAGCSDRAPAPAPEVKGRAAPHTGAAATVPAPRPPAIVDLSSSLEAIRADFNAHRGENRFLTLLAPT